MGPDQHAQLDGFGLIFPFPIRIAAILVAGRSLHETRHGGSRAVVDSDRFLGMGDQPALAGKG